MIYVFIFTTIQSLKLHACKFIKKNYKSNANNYYTYIYAYLDNISCTLCRQREHYKILYSLNRLPKLPSEKKENKNYSRNNLYELIFLKTFCDIEFEKVCSVLT